jgi:hypothetical protein
MSEVVVTKKKGDRKRHGMSKSPEFAVWHGMVGRCHVEENGSFRNYGGRGIKVCDRWRYSFATFLADMGPRPSPKHQIDREDVNGDYEPGNCRWLHSIDNGNTRRTNVRLEHDGRTRTISQWSRELGWHREKIRKRLSLGWSVGRALTTL